MRRGRTNHSIETMTIKCDGIAQGIGTAQMGRRCRRRRWMEMTEGQSESGGRTEESPRGTVAPAAMVVAAALPGQEGLLEKPGGG